MCHNLEVGRTGHFLGGILKIKGLPIFSLTFTPNNKKTTKKMKKIDYPSEAAG